MILVCYWAFEEERFVKRTTDTAKLGLIDSSVGDPSSATTPSSIGGTGEEFTSVLTSVVLTMLSTAVIYSRLICVMTVPPVLLRIIAGGFFHLSLPGGESVKRDL